MSVAAAALVTLPVVGSLQPLVATEPGPRCRTRSGVTVTLPGPRLAATDRGIRSDMRVVNHSESL